MQEGRQWYQIFYKTCRLKEERKVPCKVSSTLSYLWENMYSIMDLQLDAKLARTELIMILTFLKQNIASILSVNYDS